MNMKLVNTMVKVGIQIEREQERETVDLEKLHGLKSDSSRLWKLATNQERSEYMKRMV